MTFCQLLIPDAMKHLFSRFAQNNFVASLVELKRFAIYFPVATNSEVKCFGC